MKKVFSNTYKEPAFVELQETVENLMIMFNILRNDLNKEMNEIKTILKEK